MINWEAIKDAVEMVYTGGAKQIKNDHWTVYDTESCIRIDLYKGE